jgi:nucleoside-diphosphate-sugar epimerase
VPKWNRTHWRETSRGARGFDSACLFVYGHGGSIFLPLLVQAARETGESIYVSAGDTYISAVHVDDAADLYTLALQQPVSGIYHCADLNLPRSNNWRQL